MSPVLFRCDGTSATGLGHVSRCLALAEALAEWNARSVFYGVYEDAARTLLRGCESVRVEEAKELAGGARDSEALRRLARGARFSWLVLDGYGIGTAYLDELSSPDVPLVVIDDYARLKRYRCAAVLNFTVGAPALHYRNGPASLLLGPRYFLARRALRIARRQTKPRTGAVRRLLIAMSGADRLHASSAVLAAVLSTGCAAEIRVITGGVGTDDGNLHFLAAQYPGRCVFLDALPDLAAELAWADACICGGGLTKYECAYLGVPSAVLPRNAGEAQETIAFVKHGAAIDWGLWPDAPPQLGSLVGEFLHDDCGRERMSRAGMALFPDDPTRNAAEAVQGICTPIRLT